MSGQKEYTLKEVEDKLLEAIRILQEKDSIFLDPDFNINERSVTHRLGMYLAELFEDLDVDCEYNRVYYKDIDEYLTKKIDFDEMKEEFSFYDTEAKTVYPDIIVHKRNTALNLLSIEVKMGWKNNKQNLDWLKTVAYKTELGYQHSAMVVLGPYNEYKISWV